MLTRVLEPEAMDTPEEASAYDAMDHAAVNKHFVDDLLEAGLSDAPGVEVLDLGCGTGQIPIELCRRTSHLKVVAVDLAENMLRIGRENVARAGLSDRIELTHADAKPSLALRASVGAGSFAAGRFAAVISNSLVHHVPEPAGVLAEAVRLASPGGLIFFRDLLRPPDDSASSGWSINTPAARRRISSNSSTPRSARRCRSTRSAAWSSTSTSTASACAPRATATGPGPPANRTVARWSPGFSLPAGQYTWKPLLERPLHNSRGHNRSCHCLRDAICRSELPTSTTASDKQCLTRVGLTQAVSNCPPTVGTLC